MMVSTRLRNLIHSKLNQLEGILLDLDFDNLGKSYAVQDVIGKLTVDERRESQFKFRSDLSLISCLAF